MYVYKIKKNNKKIKCNKCNIILSSKNALNSHIKNKHT